MKIKVPDAKIWVLGFLARKLNMNQAIETRVLKLDNKKAYKVMVGYFGGLDGTTVWSEEVISETGQVLEQWSRVEILQARIDDFKEDDEEWNLI